MDQQKKAYAHLSRNTDNWRNPGTAYRARNLLRYIAKQLIDGETNIGCAHQ